MSNNVNKISSISNSARRMKSVNVKTAKKRSISSANWLRRQLNDPYVSEAKSRGYRSRAAFKLIEINERFNFLKEGLRVVDLGAAPGGWSQISKQLVGEKGKVVALDILEMPQLVGVEFLQGDFTKEETEVELRRILGGDADVVISDMAPPTIGHQQSDHLRIMYLVELAFYFAKEVLSDGGTFVAKVFQGGTEHMLLHEIKRCFKSVKHIKPAASRKDSSESYLIAQGFIRK